MEDHEFTSTPTVPYPPAASPPQSAAGAEEAGQPRHRAAHLVGVRPAGVMVEKLS